MMHGQKNIKECTFDTWKNILIYCRNIFRHHLRHFHGAIDQNLKLTKE